MKKHILTLVFISLFAAFGFANVVTGVAAIPENYYADVDGKKGMDNILNALQTCISRNYNEISYKGLEPHYANTDFYADTLWDMYSTCRFTMAEANKAQKYVCDGWNKEHVVCQSWLGSGPMVSDMFNVYPTDARINNLRSNNVYGVVTGGFSGFSNDPQHHGLGKLGSGPSGAGTVYEPDDRYKGDFARTFFYMVARYRDKVLNSSDGSKMFTTSPTNLTAYSLSFLLDWHRNDPVSEKEIDRNQGVYGEQKNRNPFIDYPELVEYIWGDLVGQTVNLSSMKPTCEGGGGPTIKPKYGVTWSVNAEIITTDSIIENKRIQSMPSTPVSCSELSETFVGWTTSTIEDSTDEAPELLYNSPNEFPVITRDITYYAVFAHAQTGSAVEPATYSYNTDHKDGWTNTATWTNSYWILKENQYLESPTINLAGLASVTMKMRTYGGGSFNTVNIVANGNTVGTLVASNNSLAEKTWTNTASLSGNSTLRFESTTCNTSNGPAFSEVTINATASGTTYSRFITSCRQTTELLLTPDTNLPARKILIGSQIYILLNNQLFNLQGQRVK